MEQEIKALSSLKVRRYSKEQKQHIFSKIEEARRLDLSLPVVFQELADEYGVTPHAIRLTYYRLRGKALKVESAEQPEASSLQLEEGESDFEEVAKTIIQLKKERDHYKKQYEKLLKERERIKKLLGV